MANPRRHAGGAPRTSTSSPLDVGWLPFAGAGRLGLTMAPGRRQRGAFTGVRWQRDLGLDLDRLAGHHGAQTVVCLLQDHEMRAFGIAGYSEAARQRNLELLRLPIADGGTPPDIEAVRRLVAEILRRLGGGDTVVVHCAGGLGRAGTIGGCCLRAMGMAPTEVFAALRAGRGPRCPENAAQRRYVEAFAMAAGSA